jgi:uncharacterized membrane-anchored protein YjiN (DUF445 family)
MTLPMPDQSRLAGLRRMKRVATGFLVAAAALFLICVTVGDGHGVWGYLQAAAEASMIGGLADWFAVTALFRHPLRLPIPHTAIIPRKKDQIGAALATFVQRYFLTAPVIGERITAADVPGRVGEWLADPTHAARVSEELAAGLQGAARLMSDEELTQSVARFADTRLRQLDVAPIASRIIDAVISSGEHQVVLAAGLRGLMRFLDLNQDVFRKRLYAESPEWVPHWVDDRVFDRGFSAVQSFLADVTADERHELRQQYDRYLREYAEALRTDPVRAARLDVAKQKLLDHPEARAWLSSLGGTIKAAIVAGSADPDSEIRRTLASLVQRLADALRYNEELRTRIDAWLQRGVGYVLARYGDDIAELISGTVARWDAEETGRRLELQVGRDLQFIRLNGTVVGALVGVLIYTVGHFL